MSRIVVAMSGGVDSSYTAALLHSQGHQVSGITLKVWQDKAAGRATLERLEDGAPTKESRSCCGVEAMADARSVARSMGFPYYVLNYEDTFREQVIQGFVNEYLAGRTPNPCVACNDKVKFDPLLKTALGLGADSLATGHYARSERDPDSGRMRLMKAVDLRKDQTYFLYRLGQEQLERIVFPLGGMTKDQVREGAAGLGLCTAAKPESMDICFVPNGDYGELLKQMAPQAATEGPIVDLHGRELGRHQGIAFYTIGQRRGTGVSLKEPKYVVALDRARNAVIVGDEADLMCARFTAGQVSWVSGRVPEAPVRAKVKIRSSHPGAWALIQALDKTTAQVQFEEAQRAVTPGQAAVFYDGENCLGGGVIE